MPSEGNIKVCLAASECAPFAKTGGLADVCGSLPKALAAQGCEVRIFMPLYKNIKTDDYGITPVDDLRDIPVAIGEREVTFSVSTALLPGSDVKVYFIDCPYYYGRETVYTDDNDEDERFILFQFAVLETLQRLEWAPDIMHCNDWQTALLPVFLKTNYSWDKLFSGTRSLLSIHNIGYQGRFASDTLGKAKLSYDHYFPGGPYEFNGTFSFLKAGILLADAVSTVSPTYAKEIQTPEYGAGLDGVLSAEKDHLYGILNGIDTEVWSPETDPLIRYTYDTNILGLKGKNKIELFKRIERNFDPDAPTIGIVTRLAGQKGIEILEPVLDRIINEGFQFVLLGSGEEKYEKFFRAADRVYHDRFLAYIGYSNELSHLITAGCDFTLMPSQYEPCGLNQMYSLNYGTIPIVRKTGGLADTVFDYNEDNENGNGFTFTEFSGDALFDAILRAKSLYYEKEKLQEVMLRGMTADFSWDKSAGKYISLYEKLMNGRQ